MGDRERERWRTILANWLTWAINSSPILCRPIVKSICLLQEDRSKYKYYICPISVNYQLRLFIAAHCISNISTTIDILRYLQSSLRYSDFTTPLKYVVQHTPWSVNELNYFMHLVAPDKAIPLPRLIIVFPNSTRNYFRPTEWHYCWLDYPGERAFHMGKSVSYILS